MSAPGSGRAPEGPRQLLVLHHAGGSAGPYQRLVRALGARGREAVAVDLPGRGHSAGEPPRRSMAEAVNHLVEVVTRDFEPGCALFGHSMGGLIAFETARELERLGRPAGWAGVSGCLSPAAAAAGPATDRRRWSDDRLTEYVRELGGTPEEALRNPELRDYLLGVLRADLAVVDGHRATAHAQLRRTPGAVFCGLADPVASPDGWCRAFRHPMTVHSFAGGHFYLFDRVEEVADRIDAALGRPRPGGPEPGAPSGGGGTARPAG
ncbi:thioesterase II family protein [Streptomyces inhibens]|uniref:thioesterase II family protein n=1 Tax=Streptomyces inhibens TaxID=2293571 RepID=UPI001EE6B97A|nr:alpha/beta fold hydrolase [Streptomyces inhibens]UKY54621.1 alpha/beta fold hydrolase [Streptomyces inhibens]